MAREELKDIIAESVRETMLEAFLALVPEVSEEEQKEIESIVGEPSDYKREDFFDGEEWIGR
ncbi:MAG: hypothetical protein GXO66_09405 [Euryarchaeota archaeon]|nr:hypothetical protein [Euryarchaeota archaeon]